MTQLERVLAFLKAHPGEQFTAKGIAAAITQQFADDYTSKRNNPRFADERSFTAQVAAEIGAHKKALQRAGVVWQDRPKPRRYFWKWMVMLPVVAGRTSTHMKRKKMTKSVKLHLFPKTYVALASTTCILCLWIT